MRIPCDKTFPWVLLFDIVNLTLEFDLLFKKNNLVNNIWTVSARAFIFYISNYDDKSFPWVPTFFKLVTLTLEFNLLFKNFKGLYRVLANFGPLKLLSNFWEIVGIILKYRMFNTSWNMTLFKICTWFRYIT